MPRVDEQNNYNIAQTDFVRRSRHGRLRNTAMMFIGGILAAMWVAFNPEILGGRVVFVGAFVACLAVPLLYTLYAMQRNLDLVMGVEFQNALFSAAIFEKNSFTVIINQEGGIVFNDPELYTFFPNITQDNFVDSIAAIAGLSRSDVERLYYALVHRKKEHFTFPFKPKGAADPTLVRVTIKPLNRPQGYFIIQGRFFVPSRKDDALLAAGGVVASSLAGSSQYICQLMHQAPAGVYVVSPSGHIRFVNTRLEQALGYDAGQIVKDEMTLSDLRYVADMAFARDDEWQLLEDRRPIRGRVMLRRKNGSLLRTMIRQDVSVDADGNVLMLMGVVDILDI